VDTTDKVWIGAIGGLLLYEGWTLANERRGDTLSESVWRHISRRPLVPFALGALVAHFVWQSQEVYDEELRKELLGTKAEVKSAAADVKSAVADVKDAVADLKA
jgi:hypothetical protein